MNEKNIIKFKKLIISESGSALPPFSAKDYEKRLEEELVKKGFYNGDILCCKDYKKVEDILYANCYNFKFFDLLLRRFDKRGIFMVNVNAVIEVDGESIILIKRIGKVSSYKGYFDFPAGFVPFGENLLNRMINRIEEDTKIRKEWLLFEEEPFLVWINKSNNGFCLYYRVKLKKTAKEIAAFFDKEFKSSKPILLKRTEIEHFIKQNKKIYPLDVLRVV